MESQTSLVARQMRIRQWAAQIRECQNRPQDMDVSAWCSLNGITKSCYYYRLKQVRKTCLEATGMELPTFIELDSHPDDHEHKEITQCSSDNREPAAIIRSKTGIVIEIFSTASAQFLENLFRVLAYAE